MPVEEYLLPISDIDQPELKIPFFTTTAQFFNSILNTLALLHEKEFFNEDPSDISHASAELVL